MAFELWPAPSIPDNFNGITAVGYAGQKVLVLGLGRTGISAAKSLQAGGARVLAYDDNIHTRNVAAAQHITIIDAADSKILPLLAPDVLVLSPGIPWRLPKPHPIVAALRQRGTRIITDIQIFCEALNPRDHCTIAVTGSNGKSTTAALLAHLLAPHAVLVGNIGVAALSLSPNVLRPQAPANRCVVILEVSSFQLELIDRARFDIAVWLNISMNHLDRHGTIDDYVAAKMMIFSNQGRRDHAVIALDDSHSQALLTTLDKRVNAPMITPVSTTQTLSSGVYVQDHKLIDAMTGTPNTIADLRQARALKGAHNYQNIAAAYAVVGLLQSQNLSPALPQTTARLMDFAGLPHRQELVATYKNITLINDSKATSPEATARALVSYPNIYWIAGGQPKPGGITSLLPHLSHVRQAYVIGQAAHDFAQTLNGHVPCQSFATIAEALAVAFKHAVEKAEPATILLSPACASFDQYKDFEDRGDQFRASVKALLANQKS